MRHQRQLAEDEIKVSFNESRFITSLSNPSDLNIEGIDKISLNFF